MEVYLPFYSHFASSTYLLKEPSDLPSDPYIYPVPQSSGIVLKFYNYGRPIDA